MNRLKRSTCGLKATGEKSRTFCDHEEMREVPARRFDLSSRHELEGDAEKQLSPVYIHRVIKSVLETRPPGRAGFLALLCKCPKMIA